MDQKMVKKMKKRKDLDRLIGNGRKHIRKKSGHVLLRTESQSSASSDDIEHFSHLSVVKYKKSRCSSFLIYASICLSICTLILCCVIFGLIFVLRTHVNQLQTEVRQTSTSTRDRTHEIQEIYSRLQTLQLYVHRLNLNMSKQFDYFQKATTRFTSLEKEFRKFRNYETLLGSLSNVPARLKHLKGTSDNLINTMTVVQRKLDGAYQKIDGLTSKVSKIVEKKLVDGGQVKENSTSAPLVGMKLDEISRRLHLLESNVTDLNRQAKTPSSAKGGLDSEAHNSPATSDDQRIGVMEKRLNATERQLEALRQLFGSGARKGSSTAPPPAAAAAAAPSDLSNNITRLEQEIQSNKRLIAAMGGRRFSPAEDGAGARVAAPREGDAASLEQLNFTLTRLLKRLPDVRITLGFGVASNSSFPSSPLGRGVVLTRDEYYKLRSFWAKASDSFVLSVQSKQRVDKMEKKFETLKKQVVDAVKNIKVLEAVGLKATERPVDKNRPELEVNVPIPVYTTPRDPNAPTPDPHLHLPWVKNVRQAEINFARWNRNGDDVLSGDELDPAALRGFMGPYTPSMEQMMHFDVNNDKRLSKKEVLCLFGYIPWPCTGEPVEMTTANSKGGSVRPDVMVTTNPSPRSARGKPTTSSRGAATEASVASPSGESPTTRHARLRSTAATPRRSTSPAAAKTKTSGTTSPPASTES